MKETGLMFKAPLVRAILEGRKTQTRRVVKRLPLRINRDANAMEIDVANIENGEFAKRVPCPMGQPGDLIYVRETFAPYERDCFYRADSGSTAMGPWKPAIHMPKELARIWLEVTGVRVERLQDISNEDAIAEGVNRIAHGREGSYYSAIRNEQHPKNWICPDDAFRELWESTGGDWDANPRVWAIDFKVLSATGRPA